MKAAGSCFRDATGPRQKQRSLPLPPILLHSYSECPASGLHKASSHPTTVQPSVIPGKVHSLGNLMWGVFAAGMCVAGAPKTDRRQRNPEPPATSSAREWNVLPGCCWQEVGSLGAGEGGGSCHKATSVLVETEGGWDLGWEGADCSC